MLINHYIISPILSIYRNIENIEFNKKIKDIYWILNPTREIKLLSSTREIKLLDISFLLPVSNIYEFIWTLEQQIIKNNIIDYIIDIFKNNTYNFTTIEQVSSYEYILSERYEFDRYSYLTLKQQKCRAILFNKDSPNDYIFIDGIRWLQDTIKYCNKEYKLIIQYPTDIAHNSIQSVIFSLYDTKKSLENISFDNKDNCIEHVEKMMIRYNKIVIRPRL